MDFTGYAHCGMVQRTLKDKFPYFAKVLEKRFQDFGQKWLLGFEKELETFFGGDLTALGLAVEGYGRFALDGMRLQKKFDKTGEYIPKTYNEVALAVYLDRAYMLGLYLPGIYLSHFLWPHHYRQLLYFHEAFVTRAREISPQVFHDVGVGTGFYSKEMLTAFPGIIGKGFDISPFSMEHALSMCTKWGLDGRYHLEKRDILLDHPDERADIIINVEVLEHLENPQDFLESLYRMLKPGGLGFITAAITAPNADHIYLYRTVEELAAQLVEAGFDVLESIDFPGYEPKPGDSVPKNGICIVKKGG